MYVEDKKFACKQKLYQIKSFSQTLYSLTHPPSQITNLINQLFKFQPLTYSTQPLSAAILDNTKNLFNLSSTFFSLFYFQKNVSAGCCSQRQFLIYYFWTALSTPFLKNCFTIETTRWLRENIFYYTSSSFKESVNGIFLTNFQKGRVLETE
jgi:hypothetical protein